MEKKAENCIIVFAGTSEGRRLYEFCADREIRAIFCVATEYGRQVLYEACSSRQDIKTGRMDAAQMFAFFQREKPVMIVDATHPYAAQATENIRRAAQKYQQEEKIQDRVYYRVLRSLTETGTAAQEKAVYSDGMSDCTDTDVIYCVDMHRAVACLASTEGNIFVTTGSKQLQELCKLKKYADRIYLRILPNPDILRECLDRGFRQDHIVCMQGPFSTEMNRVVLQEYNIRYLLTKQSGKTGGYPQKVTAAAQCHVRLVVILPPQETDGVSVEEMKEIVAGIE